MIPLELHKFIAGALSAREFRDWLYGAPELIEPWFTADEYLAILELDYDDRGSVDRLRERLASRFVPMPAVAYRKTNERDDVEVLLNAIRGAPDDPRSYLVLGDHLQQLGDPRGELIGLQASLLRQDPRFMKDAEKRVLTEHAEALYGPALPYRQWMTFHWFLGFVARAFVHCDAPRESADAVRALFAGHPSFALLREVRLMRERGRASIEAAIDALGDVSDSTLSVLRIRGEDDNEGDWSRSLGELGAVWRAHPRLRVLDLVGYTMRLGEPELPELLSLSMRSELDESRQTLWHVFDTAWPSLENLEVRLQQYYQHNQAPLELPEQLGRGLPRLRHLTFVAEDNDAFWHRLSTDPLLTQLRTLQASVGAVGLDLVEDYAPRFQHLDTLLLRATTTPEPGRLSRLRALLPRAMFR